MYGLGLALMAAAVGCLATMVGVGGGFLIVPILILVWGLSAQVAAGTSLVMIVFTSLSSTVAYSRQKRIDYRLGGALAVGTFPGAILGAYLAGLVKSEVLTGLMGLFFLGLSIWMLIAPELPDRAPAPGRTMRRKVDAEGHVFEYPARNFLALPGSFVAGMTSGAFGIGGGVLVVPLLRLGLGVPMHVASATSMFMMIFTSISAAGAHAYMGHVDLAYAVPLCVGIVGGTQAGAFLARRATAKTLERMLAVYLLVMGARMIVRIFQIS